MRNIYSMWSTYLLHPAGAVESFNTQRLLISIVMNFIKVPTFDSLRVFVTLSLASKLAPVRDVVANGSNAEVYADSASTRRNLVSPCDPILVPHSVVASMSKAERMNEPADWDRQPTFDNTPLQL